MHFKNLKINQWQQFEKIDIDLHDRLTILTGSNGSGKTTILNIFARHNGWNMQSLSIPKEEKNTGFIKFFQRYYSGADRSNEAKIGTITYSNNVSEIRVPQGQNASYQLQLSNQQAVKCFYIPSHRSIFRYQAVVNIPIQKKDKAAAFNEVSSLNFQRYMGNGNERSTSLAMKNTLIGWVINGYGVKNSQKTIMASDDEQIQFFEGFQGTLRKILPKTLGFEFIEIRKMEIVFVCNGGNDEFLLETASGGISALIDIAWQIYMFASKENSEFTVIIDEIENHLHPTMQRAILQDLLNAFPEAKFIVSTHSPLIVSSVKESYVYALTYNESNKIFSRKLDFLNEAKTATQILDEVLGVSFTMPIWVEDDLKKIIARHSDLSAEQVDFSALRKDLSDIGLEKMLPHAIKEIVERF